MVFFYYYFELVGWVEIMVIIWFWLFIVIICGLGVVLFYGEWFVVVGV